MKPIEKIAQARAQIQAAQVAMTKAVEEAFPKGCSVSVCLGRANIVATVESYGSDQNAGYIQVRNQRTGRVRFFHVLCDWPNRLGV